jgi:hypothetical protein
METKKLIKLTDSEYFGEKNFFNFSLLKELLKSPLHFQTARVTPKEATPAMKLGRTIHTALLEPLRFANEYLEEPQLDKRTKEYKEFAAKNQDKFLYSSKDVNPILEKLEIIKKESNTEAYPSLLRVLNQKTINENAIFWDKFKCKIDAYDEESSTLIDVKTTSDASPEAFQRTIFNSAYSIQLAHYAKGLMSAGKDVNEYKIIAIQTSAPFDVVEYEMSVDVMSYSYQKLQELYDKLENVLIFDDHTGTNENRVVGVGFPKWFQF